MSNYQVSIRPGNIARHTPKSAAAQGREAAVVDVARSMFPDDGSLGAYFDSIFKMIDTQRPTRA